MDRNDSAKVMEGRKELDHEYAEERRAITKEANASESPEVD